jgi:hypothetical protein
MCHYRFSCSEAKLEDLLGGICSVEGAEGLSRRIMSVAGARMLRGRGIVEKDS